MTDPQDETLENQTENSDQSASTEPPASPRDDQNLEEPLEDKGNGESEKNEPVPPQFQSPYFPNGVYEDARSPEKEGASYDPFAVQTDAGEDHDDVPKRKVRIMLGVIALALIAALVYALVTGQLVMLF